MKGACIAVKSEHGNRYREVNQMIMRSYAGGLLCLLMLLTSPGALSTVSPLRVVLDDNYPPYSFRDDHGRLQGLRIDLWHLWSEIHHRPVVLRGEHWAEAKRDLLSGQADVIDTIFDTPRRQQTYQFAPPYAEVPVRIYFDKSITGISDLNSLEGFTLGVKKGDACIQDLVESGVTHFSSYDNYYVLIQAAGRGEVHLFCMDGPPATFLLYKAGLANQFKYSHRFNTGHMSYAVLRGHAAMLPPLVAGFADLPQARVKEINLRWLGQSNLPAGSESTHYLRIISWALILALSWVILLILWSRGLRLRVAQRTRELVDALGEVQQAHASADEARENLLAVIDAIPDLLFEMDGEGRYISYRTQMHAINTWVKPEDFIGRRVDEVLPREVAQVILDALEDARKHGSSHGRQIGVTLGGHQIWFELSVGRKQSPDEGLERYIILARDISERRLMAEELEKHRSHLEELVQGKTRQLALANARLTQLSRIQRALSRSSQALVRAQREDSYQHDVCRIVVEECGHRMAWVGYVQDDEDQTVRPQAWAGEGLDYLDNLRITRSEGRWGSGPAGQSLRSGQPVVMTDIKNDAGFSPWQQAAEAHGFHASIAIPFRLDDGQQGLFSIYAGQAYAGQPYAFSSEEIELLQELISDFAYGIAGLRLRQRHSETMEELAKRAEEEVVAHKRTQSLADLLQLILDSMTSVILVWDSRQRLIRWNQNVKDFFPLTSAHLTEGMSRDAFIDLLRANAEFFEGPKLWSEWEQPSHEELHTATGQTLEYTRQQAKDGSHIMLISNITEISSMRETLQRNERLAALGKIVAGVAHDMNTPIGIALTASTTLAESVRRLDEEAQSGEMRRSVLSVFLTNSKLASQLIENNLHRAIDLISGFKQVAVDQASAQRRTFDLDVMLQTIVSTTIMPLLKPQGHQLTLDIAGDMHMDSYPGPLGQVITNLVSNAIMHAFEDKWHGRMQLMAHALNGGVEIRFSDDGKGIPPENLQKIFDPFFTTRMGRGGTGLGLSNVHTIVTELLGGSISVSSVLGQGTEFRLLLPLRAPLHGGAQGASSSSGT